MSKRKPRQFNIVLLWKQNDWGFYHRRDEAILEELAHRSEVGLALHVEHVPLRLCLSEVKSWITSKDESWRRVFRYHVQKAVLPLPVRVKENSARNYYLTSIITLTGGKNGVLGAINRWLLRGQIKILNGWLVKHGHPTVILAYPPRDFLLDTVSTLQHELLIADIEDDIIQRSNDEKFRTRAWQNFERFLPKCDWIFATSSNQDVRYRELAGQEIHCLPNAAGIQRQVLPIASPKTESGIRAGFVGTINQTLDVALLRRLLQEFPDVEFVFAGAISAALRPVFESLLREFANLRYIGHLHHSKMQSCLANFHILLNIKKADGTTAGGDSQKLYEYLATGKPILSSSIPPAPSFSEFVYVSDDPEDSVRLFREAIAENSDRKRQQRVMAAAENSWKVRVDVIISNIQDRLCETSASIKRPATRKKAEDMAI